MEDQILVSRRDQPITMTVNSIALLCFSAFVLLRFEGWPADVAGWTGLALGALFLTFSVEWLIRPPRLTLTADALKYRGLMGQTVTLPWANGPSFHPRGRKGREMIAFQPRGTASDAATPRTLLGLWPVPVDDLAAALNQRVTRASGATP